MKYKFVVIQLTARLQKHYDGKLVSLNFKYWYVTYLLTSERNSKILKLLNVETDAVTPIIKYLRVTSV